MITINNIDDDIKFIEEMSDTKLTDFQKLYLKFVAEYDGVLITGRRGYGKRYLANKIRDIKEKIGDVKHYEYRQNY